MGNLFTNWGGVILAILVVSINGCDQGNTKDKQCRDRLALFTTNSSSRREIETALYELSPEHENYFDCLELKRYIVDSSIKEEREAALSLLKRNDEEFTEPILMVLDCEDKMVFGPVYGLGDIKSQLEEISTKYCAQ